MVSFVSFSSMGVTVVEDVVEVVVVEVIVRVVRWSVVVLLCEVVVGHW